MYTEISYAQYIEDFEKPLLVETARFYSQKARMLLATLDCTSYLRQVESWLHEEHRRAECILHPQTVDKVRQTVRTASIQRHMKELVDMPCSGLINMLRSNDLKCLRHLCMLFCCIPGAKDMLICKSTRHLQQLGTQLVLNRLRDKSTVEMVDDLILLKIKWDKFVKEGFSCCYYADDCCEQVHKFDEKCGEGAGVDREFEKMVDSSFGIFLNRDQGMPKHLATYLDWQMKQWQSRDQVHDPDLESRLDSALLLFRALNCKDEFERHYRLRLSIRLLDWQYMLNDADKMVVRRLKIECGSAFSAKLDAMLHDVQTSSSINMCFSRNFCPCSHPIKDWTPEAFQFYATILTTGCWPVSSAQIQLPPELKRACSSFQKFYSNKYPARTLSWQTCLGWAELDFLLGRKTHKIIVNTQQLCLLLQFNRKSSLSCAELGQATDMNEQVVLRNVQSLVCPTERAILKKDRIASRIRCTNVFTVNHEFGDKNTEPLVSFTSAHTGPTSMLETPSTLVESRNHSNPLVDAAIVRTMKACETIEHSDLIARVTLQLSGRLHIEPSMIKSRIESLIDREFIERSTDNQSVYTFLT